MDVREIKEYEKGKYAVNFGHFYEKNYTLNENTDFDISFNVIGIIPDSLVNTLVNGKKYFIKGAFNKFLDMDFENYIHGPVFTNDIELSGKDTSGKIKVDMGIMLFYITKVTLTSNSN